MNSGPDAKDVSAWRADTRLNQQEFGEMLGLSRATIVRWESGRDVLPPWVKLAMEGWYANRSRAAGIIMPELETRIEYIVSEKIEEQLKRIISTEVREQLRKQLSDRQRRDK